MVAGGNSEFGAANKYLNLLPSLYPIPNFLLGPCTKLDDPERLHVIVSGGVKIFFGPSSMIKSPEPDWAKVHRELGRSGVTLDLLWQDYRAGHSEGYQYSAFCLHYRAFAQTLPVTLHQSHAPGERLFIDYRGQTVTVIDPTTGEARQAQIFVAVLGASNPTSAIRTLRGPICMGFARQNAHKWLIVRRRALQKAL